MPVQQEQNDAHPHAPAGTPEGGQFTQNKGGGSAPPAKAPATPAAKGKPPPPAPKPAPKAAPKSAPAPPSAPPPGPPGSSRLNLKRGGKNDAGEVRNLQALMSDLKVGNVAQDGSFGPATEAAVKAAQAKLGMKPTGRATSAFIRRMADAHALSPCVGGKVSASVVIAAADGETHTGAMIALIPTDEDAQRLEVDAGADVGESPDDMHCTLVYLGNAADFGPDERAQLIQAVTDAVAGMAPVEADGFAVSMFNPHGADPCIVLGLSGVELVAAQQLVDDATDGIADLPEQHEPWIPHVTLEYTDDPSLVAEYVDQTGAITFDRIRIAFGDDVTDIDLAEPMPVTAAAGADVTPGHDQLHHYWVAGPGLAKWQASPTPWTSLVGHLVEEGVSPEKAKVYASRWFIEVMGYAAGSDKNRVAHGHPPRGNNIGPG